MSNTPQSSAPRVITPLRLVGLAAEEAVKRLSEWGTSVAQLLSGDLRLGVHAACQVVTVKMTTDGSGLGSVVFATKFQTRPAGVLLMACVDSGGMSKPIPAYAWTWRSGSVNLDVIQSTAVSPVTLTALVVLG